MILFIRRLIYCLALLWALFLYGYVAYTLPSTSTAIASLMRLYALTALALLYITLTPGLIRAYFPAFRYNPILIKARQALGISTFFFALAHATLGFIFNLGGRVSAVLYLSRANQWALVFSATALLILTILALTSINRIKVAMGRYWKPLHRLVYVAAIFVLFHAFLIGSHFASPQSPIPTFVNFSSLIFIYLEGGAIAKKLVESEAKRPSWLQKTYAILIGIALFAAFALSRYAYFGQFGHIHISAPVPVEVQ